MEQKPEILSFFLIQNNFIFTEFVDNVDFIINKVIPL